MQRFQNDWYSPSRLLSSPAQYDFPGDRFIPNRSLMDIDRARSLLTSRTKEASNSKCNEEYQRRLAENLALDSEGRPFRMLVFRGSPRSSRKSLGHIDELRRDEEAALALSSTIAKKSRCLPKTPCRILDAPRIKDDYYLNIMDWGKNNILAVALGSVLYLWNAENGSIQMLSEADGDDDYPASVAWSEDAKMVAVGYFSSKLQLWDVETSKLVRNLEGHHNRVGTLAWNGHILTSGSLDKSIINHDARAENNTTACLRAHRGEVCGLKWSNGSNILASGGNDNCIYIWNAYTMRSSRFLHQFNDHCAAVKALAWCPYQSDILASGGGLSDGCIKMWSIKKGACIKSIDTKAQICGLEWNIHHRELLSGHGYSTDQHGNQLCLWRYPSLDKIGEIQNHSSRILHLSQSPDGQTVVSAGADETLRFWDVFGPPLTENSRETDLDSFLSLKASPIR
ncbi:cell division cycle 20.2, cofactor of APC complex-like [Malania oleifera]|uniref:cell division cycle 20.2, cofactor of APC complex-like n=1 Tax=Malania oleifera TaxID=397392 RepID=UPI0025ADDF88|nr:cell division cycle 20.2, cofactor of APC complex-like [Malania oleifera]